MKGLKLSIRIKILIVLTFFLLAAIVVICLCMRGATASGCHQLVAILQILFSLIFIALSWFIISMPGKIVRNGLILVVAFISLLILGILSYPTIADRDITQCNWVVQLLWPFNNTLSVFFPSRGDYAAESAQYGYMYWFFQTLVYVFIAWVGMAIFGKKLMNGTCVRLIPAQYKNIIWKYSDSGFELAKDMRRNLYSTSEPIFVLEDSLAFDETQEKTIFNKISSENILVVNSNTDSRLRRHLHGHRHFFITEDQNDNVNMALKILQQILSNPHFQTMTNHLFVRCEIEGIDALFQEKINGWCTMHNCNICNFVEIHMFNQSDLTARQFIFNHPTLDLEKHPDFFAGGSCLNINTETLQVTGEADILILGLGWVGYEILKKTLCDTRYPGNNTVRITVIDDNFKYLHGAFATVFEEARKFGVSIEVNPEFYDKGEIGEVNKRIHNTGSSRFYSWLAEDKRILNFNRIIIALGDDELNINTALDIHRFRARFLTSASAIDDTMMPEKIFVHVREKGLFNYFDTTQSPVIPFGGISEINTCSILIDEKMDTVAKMVNYVYSRYDTDMVKSEDILKELENPDGDLEKNWSSASIFNQDSSRAVAMSINNMVRICGGLENLEKYLNDKEKLECLAKMEHRRWNTFHVMKGVTAWPFDDVCEVKGKKNGKLSFYGSLFKHICLVPFEDLDMVSDKINELNKSKKEDYKEVDRRIIRHFPIFYRYRNQGQRSS